MPQDEGVSVCPHYFFRNNQVFVKEFLKELGCFFVIYGLEKFKCDAIGINLFARGIDNAIFIVYGYAPNSSR